MDFLDFSYYVQRLLPDIQLTFDPENKTLYKEDIIGILTNHFKNKVTVHSGDRLLQKEAFYIHFLFPAVNHGYILEQLRIFEDKTDRTEIVLRLILHKENSEKTTMNHPIKRSLSDNEDSSIAHIKKLKTPATVTSQLGSELFLGELLLDQHQNFLSDFANEGVGGQVEASGSALDHSYTFITPTNVENCGIIGEQPFLEEALPEVKLEMSEAMDDGFNEKEALLEVKLEMSEAMDDGFNEKFVQSNESKEFRVVNTPVVTREEVFDEMSECNLNNMQNGFPSCSRDQKNTIDINRNNECFTEYDFGQEQSTLLNRHNPSQPASTIEPLQRVIKTEPETSRTVICHSSSFNLSSSSDEKQALADLNNLLKLALPSISERKEADFDNTSTSSQHQSTSNNVNVSVSMSHPMDLEMEFDLINHLHNITKVPNTVIKSFLNMNDFSAKIKPPPKVLNRLINHLLSWKIQNPGDDEDDVLLIESDDEPRRPEKDAKLLTENVHGPSTSSKIVEEIEFLPAIKKDKLPSVDTQLCNKLCAIFTDACPNYIKKLCGGKEFSDHNLNDIINVILDANGQYPKRPEREPEPEVLVEDQLQILKDVLPDADPDYIRMIYDQAEGRPDMLKRFIDNAVEKCDYPKLKEYQRRQQLSAQQKQYTTEFSVENFVKVIPDPIAFFSDSSRNIKMSAADEHYALVYLRNKYRRLSVRTIQGTFTSHYHNLGTVFMKLDIFANDSSYLIKTCRKPIELPKVIENIPLLQELAFNTHRAEIEEYLKMKKQREIEERRVAKEEGLMKTCSCCYDDEVLPIEIYRCERGCEFCKNCIIKSSEVRFGEGKLDFPCIMNCSADFSLQTLQAVLCPKLFSKIAQKKAVEEIKAAGIEELETCPFCDFATIIPKGYNIFPCMNPECMKESCRLCKEPSHIPLRCDEIEKDADVKARVYVENKMTEALLRKCWKCGIQFYKEDGCNKMTCSCGATMCYICKQPVRDYKHFNGNGGDRLDLCPLYSDTHTVNQENVLKGAEAAKADIGNVQLKHDPTADVNKHYEERKKKNPQSQHLVGQQLFGQPVNRPPFVPVPHPPLAPAIIRQHPRIQIMIRQGQELRQAELVRRELARAGREVQRAEREIERAEREIERARREVERARWQNR